MVTPSAGVVVLVTFPFSDLTASRLRPAVVLADAGRSDWVLCQVTSNPYGDPRAIEITDRDFTNGGLHTTSYARPGKLFTANQRLMTSQVGVLSGEALHRIIAAIVALLTPPDPKVP